MKTIFRMFAVSAVTAVTLVLIWMGYISGIKHRQSAVSGNTGPSLEKIQLLSELTTLRVDVADAMVTELKGYTGEIKAVIIVRGSVSIGVDLSAARFESVDQKAHTAVIVLPKPQVQSVSLDHERTKLLGVWPSGLWMIVPGGGDADATAINRCYADAQRAVAKVAEDLQMMGRARRQAELVLGAFCSAMGWKVEIRWVG